MSKAVNTATSANVVRALLMPFLVPMPGPGESTRTILAHDRKLRVSFGNCDLQVGEPTAKAKPETHGNKKEQAGPELARVN